MAKVMCLACKDKVNYQSWESIAFESWPWPRRQQSVVDLRLHVSAGHFLSFCGMRFQHTAIYPSSSDLSGP